jgi:hypothetical protein
MDAHTAPCLDLELICRGTQSSEYRQRPLGPPWERLRTRRWGQFFGAPLSYFELFIRQSTVSPREVPELEVRERPPSTLRNIDGGPREVPEMEVRKLEMLMAGPLGGASGRSRNGHHRS